MFNTFAFLGSSPTEFDYVSTAILGCDSFIHPTASYHYAHIESHPGSPAPQRPDLARHVHALMDENARLRNDVTRLKEIIAGDMRR